MLEITGTEMYAYKTLFLDYCILGGMPAVISRYIENDSFSGTIQIQKQIHLDYEKDVRKYALGLDQAKIISVYRSVPAQLAKENKKFQFKAGAWFILLQEREFDFGRRLFCSHSG